MSTAPTAFARAIEEFILEKQNNEDKSSAFYKEVLSKVHAGRFRRDSSDGSQQWAQELCDYVDDLQRRNLKDSVLRKTIEKLGPVVSGFNQYTGACDVIIQAGPAAAMVLYGGVRIMLQLIQKVQDCYSTVVDMLDDIGTFIQCFHPFATSYPASELVQEHLVKSYKLIIEFWLKASRLLSSKSPKVFFSRNCQLSREWQNYGTRLERCCAKVRLAVEAAEADIRHKRDLQNEVRLKENERKANVQQVVSWIKSCEGDDKLDFRGTVRTKASSRHGRSGEWLLANPSFQSWLAADKSTTLWLRGQPGAGKSVLVSYLLQHLDAQEINGKRAKTISYFFFFNDPTRRKTITALRSIAIQLLTMYTSVPDAVQHLHSEEAANHVEKLEDIATAVKVVAALSKQVSRVHIVLDGLDECEDRENLLSILKQLSQAPTYGIVKWLFTSRPEKDIEMSLSSYIPHCVDISTDSTHEDIRAFMTEKLRGELGVDCDHCVDRWISRADGNFLWAAVTLEIMSGEGLPCDDDVDEALARFPAGLQGCYERSLQHLVRKRKAPEVELAKKVFTLIVGAVQPLHLSEVEHALIALRNAKQSSRISDYDEKWKPRPGVIENLCSGLVVFDRSQPGSEDDPLLKFGHKSVQDFFVQDVDDLEVSENLKSFFTTEEDAALLLGEACLRYLSFARYERPQDVQSMLTNGLHAFLPHAAAFWHNYLSHTSQLPEREQVERILRFIKGPCFWNCIAVQAHTVPHQFARFYEGRRSRYKLQASGDGATENPNNIHYASPLPLWLDHESCGPEGQRAVDNFQAFIVQWHPVLNSAPSAIGECVMDHNWNKNFPERKRWRSNRVVAWELSHASKADELPAQYFRMSILDVSLDYTTARVCAVSAMETATDNQMKMITFQCWNTTNGSQSATTPNKASRSNLILTLQNNAQLLTDSSQARHISLLPKDLIIEVYEAQASPNNPVSSSMKHFPPANQSSKAWGLFDYSSSAKPGDQTPIVAVFCISDPSFDPGADSGFGSEDESGESSGSDSESDESSAFQMSDDSGVDLEAESDQSPDRCMIIAQSDKPPVYSFWTSKRSFEEVDCAISSRRKLAIWSQSTSEASIVDLTAGSLTPIPVYLPEPKQLTMKMMPDASRKEFHFSEDGNELYYLVYAANENASGIEQSLTITLLSLSCSDEGPSLYRSGQSCTITYCSAGTLRHPSILTAWTSEYLYAALPQLSCDPKVVRLRLSDLSDTRQPHFETLQDPVYFPASTLDRSPKLYSFDHGDDQQNLILALDSQSAPNGDAMLHRPLVMQWTLDKKEGWRPWHEKLDGESDQYKTASDVCSRLRGTFVDANQRFNVPIRSGLDWRKKAYVSCV